MSLLKLTPTFKDYLWGGDKLIHFYNKSFKGDILAETWELSTHPDGKSIIENGKFKGETLESYITKLGKSVLGDSCDGKLPVLVKFIDAKKDLSIQVHPNDEYALKYENQLGKTEMWYVLDCEKDSYIYYGFSKKITALELNIRIKNNSLLEVLNKVYVNKGDVFFIKAGTVHAIGKGILLAEIQQNSNLTYRVYDYGRVGRELHITKALDVINTYPTKIDSKTHVSSDDNEHLVECEYFTVDKMIIKSKSKIKIDNTSFVHVLVIDGKGEISLDNENLNFQKGDSFFIPASKISCECVVQGVGEVLLTRAGKIR